MQRNYTKEEHLTVEIFRRKSVGETNRQTAESYQLTLKQIKDLFTRQHQKLRLIEQGCTLRPKGRPSKKNANEVATLKNKCVKLRMCVEVLQNFLSETGRM